MGHNTIDLLIVLIEPIAIIFVLVPRVIISESFSESFSDFFTERETRSVPNQLSLWNRCCKRFIPFFIIIILRGPGTLEAWHVNPWTQTRYSLLQQSVMNPKMCSSRPSTVPAKRTDVFKRNVVCFQE